MLSKLKTRLLNLILRHLFPIVDVEKILTSSRNGHLYLNGISVERKKLDDLKQEINFFRNTGLWDILSNTLKHQAQVIMFTKAKSMDDLLMAKTMLYTLDIQDKILNLIDKAP